MASLFTQTTFITSFPQTSPGFTGGVLFQFLSATEMTHNSAATVVFIDLTKALDKEKDCILQICNMQFYCSNVHVGHFCADPYLKHVLFIYNLGEITNNQKAGI